MKIESKIGKSEHSDEQIYVFITDFRNFQNIIPREKVSDWEADQDSCSFKIDPVGKMSMKVIEKEPNKLIKVSSDPEISQYNFKMWIQIKALEPNDTRIKITIEPEVNKMLLPMVKSPLKQFVDSLVEKIETFDFKEEG